MPLLGAQGASMVAEQLLNKTLHWVHAWQHASENTRRVILWTDSGEPAQWDALLKPFGFEHRPQQGADLGQKMAHTMQVQLQVAQHAIIIGTDTPTLSSRHVDEVVNALDDHDTCFIPAHDGGYVLIAMKAFKPQVFEHMPWGTDQVALLTKTCCQNHAISHRWLNAEPDLDTPEDYLEAIRQHWLLPVA